MTHNTTEITVHPGQRLTNELALAIAVSASWPGLGTSGGVRKGDEPGVAIRGHLASVLQAACEREARLASRSAVTHGHTRTAALNV